MNCKLVETGLLDYMLISVELNISNFSSRVFISNILSINTCVFVRSCILISGEENRIIIYVSLMILCSQGIL